MSPTDPTAELERAYSVMGYAGPMPAPPPRRMAMTAGATATATTVIPAPARVDAGDPPALGAEQLEQIEEMFEIDPAGTVAKLQEAWDPKLNEDGLRTALASARALIDRPARLRPVLEARASLASARAELPAGFTFDGMDPSIEINPDDHKYEEAGDALGWIAFAAFPALVPGGKADFRTAPNFGSRFEYTLQEPSPAHPLEVALFADFGTFRYHSRYIARQIERSAPPYAIHLGDVYYAGRKSEFEENFARPLNPILPSTELFMLNSNHEMYSGGRWYFDFMDSKMVAHPNQRQEGSYFSLLTNRFQIIGIDTAYHKNGRFPKEDLQAWLRAKLSEGRAAGRTNILLSADQPYEYGKNAFTKLFATDLHDIAINGLVDLWFWGNTHYCGLFGRSVTARFVGSCLGHGGFPYTRKRKGQFSVVPVHFLESRARFPESTRLRQDMGNNGYCRMSLHDDGSITLRYMDWMSKLRCTAQLRRSDPGSPLEIASAVEHSD